MALPLIETLRSDDYRLDVAPGLGGVITAFTSQGEDGPLYWMRPVDLERLEESGALESASYPLVPFSNRIAEGRFIYAGREVNLGPDPVLPPHAIHGHGWRAVWQVSERSEAAMTLSYAHEPDRWPWRYEATQRFALDGSGLRVEMRLRNLSDIAMPAGLGLHPHFPLTQDVRLKAKVKAGHVGDETLLPIARREDHAAIAPLSAGESLPRGLDICFGGWEGSAEIRWPGEGRGLRMTASSALGHLVIYSPPGEDFFCVEPVSHCVNAVNLEGSDWGATGLVHLAPCEEFSVSAVFQPFMLEG